MNLEESDETDGRKWTFLKSVILMWGNSNSLRFVLKFFFLDQSERPSGVKGLGLIQLCLMSDATFSKRLKGPRPDCLEDWEIFLKAGLCPPKAR